uniref:Uncharacterized protein n=1 Tax=Oryza brachyantha TaxID=4533 RepID=J3MCB9_ORYBR
MDFTRKYSFIINTSRFHWVLGICYWLLFELEGCLYLGHGWNIQGVPITAFIVPGSQIYRKLIGSIESTKERYDTVTLNA